MVNHPPKRVVLYARVYNGVQVEDSLPIATQLAEMREYAIRREWVVVTEFVDVGVITQILDRPNLKALLIAAEKQSFDIVLVHELSRLSDSIFDTLAIFESLGKYDIGIASLKEPQFDLSTSTDRSFLMFIADIGQYHKDLSHLQAKQAKHRRIHEGLYEALIPPYGYKYASNPTDTPIIVEEEAKVVRLAFEQYATGQYSYQEIADILNKAGFHTRRGGRFSKDTVNQIVCDPFYAGRVVYKRGQHGAIGRMYPGTHEPTVSEELWNQALCVRDLHTRTAKRSSQPYLLNQIAFCHICGNKLRVQSAASGSYYREASADRSYNNCPNAQIGVPAEILDQQIGTIIRGLRLPSGWQEELPQIIERDEEPTLQNHRARLIAHRRRIKEAYTRGDFGEDEDIYHRALERIRQELVRFPSRNELRQIHQAAQILDSLPDTWDEIDLAGQRDLIQLMLREVQVDVIQERILFLRPTLPFISLFRSTPILQERDVGTFTSVWTSEMTQLETTRPFSYPTLAPITTLPGEPVDLPFLPIWPWTPSPSIRISPPLSTALKAQRKAGFKGGVAIAVPHPMCYPKRDWKSLTSDASDPCSAKTGGTTPYERREQPSS